MWLEETISPTHHWEWRLHFSCPWMRRIPDFAKWKHCKLSITIRICFKVWLRTTLLVQFYMKTGLTTASERNDSSVLCLNTRSRTQRERKRSLKTRRSHSTRSLKCLKFGMKFKESRKTRMFTSTKAIWPQELCGARLNCWATSPIEQEKVWEISSNNGSPRLSIKQLPKFGRRRRWDTAIHLNTQDTPLWLRRKTKRNRQLLSSLLRERRAEDLENRLMRKSSQRERSYSMEKKRWSKSPTAMKRRSHPRKETRNPVWREL